MESQRPPTILLVDDDPMQLIIYQRYLDIHIDYRLVKAGEGDQALEFIGGNAVDVLVTDYQMPGMSGLELIEKALALDPDLQVIMVTGEGGMATVIEAMRLGASNYLTKPVELALLKEAVDQCLKKKELIALLAARKHAEIQQAARVHSDRLAALGEMATAMAHEIHQPLSVVNILVQSWRLLKEKGRLNPEKMMKDADTVLANIRRISTIIDHVRTMGRAHGEVETVPLHTVLGNTLSLCRMQFQAHGINIEENYHTSEEDTVEVVPTELEQVFLNILANARYAVEERQKRELGYTPRVTVSTYKADGYLAAVIADNGFGVHKEDEERIFDPFFTSKPPGKGTGIGLGIGMKILEKFDGSMKLCNDPGNGAAFEVRLPVTGC